MKTKSTTLGFLERLSSGCKAEQAASDVAVLRKRGRMRRLRITPLSAALLVALANGAQAGVWRTYHNTRFGTKADVPASWTMGPPPQNNDGRSFTSPDKRAEITISGIFANIGSNDELASRLIATEGETITYKKRQDKWVVVSGAKGDRIFYRKTVLSCDDTIANDLSIEYPAADKEKYDPLVAHVAASLRPGKGYDFVTKWK
jgi:hypothetical protein